jgi:predicted Rossmann fold nucleotide-binding protein DprA/Smf involved in DNA uptake
VNQTPLGPDSQAIVLLCSHLALPKGAAKAPKPLTGAEWKLIARKIGESEWKWPRELLGHSAAEIQAALAVDQATAGRMAALLARGGPLAIELERLSALGIGVITKADAAYPGKLKERLRQQAPLVLFYAGDAGLLSRQGIAVVGSREVDTEGEWFARKLGERCAEAGLTVFSGAARGADRLAMLTATDEGGYAAGVIADSLERLIRDRQFREVIAAGRLTLVSPFNPAAGFTIANAMARNKVIYCLAAAAVVVSTASGSGGTWAGATENLKAKWAPLFVRSGPEAPAGNTDLLKLGGAPITLDTLPRGPELVAWIEAQAAQTTTEATFKQPRLFGDD